MKLNWFGQSCFKIQNEQGVTIITDPFSNNLGIKLPSMEVDIITISHQHYDHNNIDDIKNIKSENTPFIIQNNGEYEIKNVFIYGVPSFYDNTEGKEKGGNIIYLIKIDGISITHLGDLGQKQLTQKQLEILEGTDILLIPIGGKFTLNGKEAVDIINQIEPRVIIPMHYKIPGIKEPLEGIENFCKEMGVCSTERISKLKLLKKDLPQEEMKVYIMSPE